MLASSKNLADEYRLARARLRRRSWRAVDARIARRRRQLRRRRPLAGSLSRLRAPRLPRRPARPLSTAPPARARAAGLPPSRRGVVWVRLCTSGTRRRRATSAVHNRMLREYERACGVAPLSAER